MPNSVRPWGILWCNSGGSAAIYTKSNSALSPYPQVSIWIIWPNFLTSKSTTHIITTGPDRYIIFYIYIIVRFAGYIGIDDIFFRYAPILKLFIMARKNAWISDLNWCNYIVCPAGWVCYLITNKWSIYSLMHWWLELDIQPQLHIIVTSIYVNTCIQYQLNMVINYHILKKRTLYGILEFSCSLISESAPMINKKMITFQCLTEWVDCLRS